MNSPRVSEDGEKDFEEIGIDEIEKTIENVEKESLIYLKVL